MVHTYTRVSRLKIRVEVSTPQSVGACKTPIHDVLYRVLKRNLSRKTKHHIKKQYRIQSAAASAGASFLAYAWHLIASHAHSEPAKPWNTDGRGDRDCGDSIPASGERRDPNVGLTGLGEYIEAKSEKL